MDDNRLAQIKDRAEAATEGPWANDGAEIYQGEAGAGSPWIGETLNMDDQEHSNANAAFIAHARQDVPDLVTEVERLRTELEDSRIAFGAMEAKYRSAFNRASKQRVLRRKAEAESAQS